MVNYYFTDELYHHGVKGMKWGRRKRKEVKQRAKNYQRRLNELERKQNTLNLMDWSMRDSKNVIDKKIKKFEKKNKVKKKKEFQMNSNLLNKKIKDIKKQSAGNQKQIASILDKISKDKDLVYTTSLWRGNGSSYKEYVNRTKSLSKKYGKESRAYSTTGAKSVSSSKYIIKPATEKNKKKKKFNDPIRKRSLRRYVETYYYMV